MADFPALPLWTDALMGDTTHLTTLEFGAYMKLLISAWRTKTCDLPMSDKLLARYTGLKPAQWERMKDIILPFFTTRFRHGEHRLFQKRLRKERAYVLKRSRLQKLRRKARTLKNKETVSTAVLPELYQPTPTPTPTPIKERKKEESTMFALATEPLADPTPPPIDKLPKNGNGRSYPSEFCEFWDAYPRRPTDAKGDAYKAWRKGVIKVGVDPPTLTEAARVYAEHNAKTGCETKMVATWISKEGWTVDYAGTATDGPEDPVSGAARKLGLYG